MADSHYDQFLQAATAQDPAAQDYILASYPEMV